MKSWSQRLLGLGIAMLISSAPLFADSIVATGTSTFSSGTGFGNVLSVLSLQPGGSTTTESGSVSWNGSADVRTGDAQPGAQTNTRTIAELTAVGATAGSFSVIFNVNQQGGGTDFVTMSTFTLLFFNSAGTSLGTLTWDIGPDPLADNFQFTVAGQGTGSSGYVFNVNLMTPGLASVFSNPTNRIGLLVPSQNPIGNTNDGPENFYIGPGAPVLAPEPSSIAMMGLGLLSLLYGCHRFRQAKATQE